MTTTIGQAITSIGAAALPETDLILAEINGRGFIEHHRVADVGALAINPDTDVYLAGGLFAAGSVSAHEGRKQANLRAVMWLQFDADLTDYSTMDAAFLHRLPQDDLDGWIAAQRQDLEEIFASIGLPIHRLDYTGYGLCAYLYLEPTVHADIAMIREAHKAIIAAINATATYRLVDPVASDSGTRITRLPGSWNRKNPDTPRQVTTLSYQPGVSVTADQLRFAMKRAEQRPAQPSPPEAKSLAKTTMDEIVAAIAPHWTLGQKHAISLALAGMLAKAGVPEAQALAIVERLSHDDTKPWDRERTVRDSYARVQSGLETRGFFGLREMVPETVIAYLDERLDRYRQATTGAFRAGTIQARTEHSDDHVSSLLVEPVPDICYHGWVGEYVGIMEPLCEAPAQFHLASGLGLIGATAGRRVSNLYVSRSLYANLYLMIVGVAGRTRKDTAIEFATNVGDYQHGRSWNNPPFNLLTDAGSATALLKSLEKNPNSWLYITEYERIAINAHRESSSIFPVLNAAFNTPNRIQNNVMSNPIEAKFPYLSIVAAVQPDVLSEQMQPKDISNGFASRWLYVPGVGKAAMAEPPSLDESRIHRMYADLMRTMAKYEQGQDGQTRIKLSPDATERWIEWYERDGNRSSLTDDEESMQSRLSVHVRKLALIYAISDGADAVQLHHLEPAIAFVEWSWRHTRQMLRGWGVPAFNQLENRIEQVLKKRGPISRRVLQQNCRGRRWSAPDFARVLEAMVRNGTVEVDVEGRHAYCG